MPGVNAKFHFFSAAPLNMADSVNRALNDGQPLTTLATADLMQAAISPAHHYYAPLTSLGAMLLDTIDIFVGSQ